MLEQTASWTALRVAVRRAEHQVLDSPVVFHDALSLRIIGPAAAADIQPGRVTRRQRLSPSFRAYMAARSRFAEDELARAVSSGIRQYVILGAGLDTFGYRNLHAPRGLHVFEIDHPATQAWKRSQLAAAAIDIPPTTTLIPADLERLPLPDALAPAGFAFDQPAFFSWLGVTPYLTDAAFHQTLAFVGSLPRPSAIVFDYALPRHALNHVQQKAFDALAATVAGSGEPFQVFLDPDALHARLHALGFTRLEDLSYDDLNRRYFASRTDGFKVKSRLQRLILAEL